MSQSEREAVTETSELTSENSEHITDENIPNNQPKIQSEEGEDEKDVNIDINNEENDKKSDEENIEIKNENENENNDDKNTNIIDKNEEENEEEEENKIIDTTINVEKTFSSENFEISSEDTSTTVTTSPSPSIPKPSITITSSTSTSISTSNENKIIPKKEMKNEIEASEEEDDDDEKNDSDDTEDEHTEYKGKGFRPFITLVNKTLNDLLKTLSRKQTQPKELIQRVLNLLQRCDNPDTAFRGPDINTPSSIVVQLIKIAELCCMPPAVSPNDRMPSKLALPVLILFKRMVKLGIIQGFWPNNFVFFKPNNQINNNSKSDKSNSVFSFFRSLSKSDQSNNYSGQKSPSKATQSQQQISKVINAAASASSISTSSDENVKEEVKKEVDVEEESKKSDCEEKVKDENTKEIKSEKDKKIRTVDKFVEIVIRCGEHQHQDTLIQHLALSTLVLAATSERCHVHKNTLSSIVKLFCDVHLTGKSQSNIDYSKRAISRVVKFYTSQYAKISSFGVVAGETYNTGKAYLNDCLRLLTSFCALSKVELPKKQDLLHNDELVKRIQTRVLGLEFISLMVESPSDALVQSSKFIEKGIKGPLCNAIVENGVSINPKALSWTLKIFLSLMKHFKSSLKIEIGVFISNIFLRVFESQNSSLQQKWILLKVFFHAICKEPLTLAELYINYDCDLNSPDVFVRMVNDFAKVAQGSNTPLDSWVTPEQDEKLRALSLECLVLVMESLMNWTEEGKEQLRAYQEQLKYTTPRPLSSTDLTQQPESISPAPDAWDSEENEELKKLREQKGKKKMLEEIREKWALDPKRALVYMKKAGVIDDTAESLAKFLRETEGLDKKATGEFIGGSKPFNKDVLKAYVALFDFSGMELDEALRFFLGQFLLPGEGQVVDRIMENFGQRYYLDNAETKRFEDADAVYKLSFAIIMLATDIHNPKVKNKLTFEQWEKMVNKDLAMGLEIEYLQNVFKRIAAKKLELAADDSKTNTSASQQREGIGSVLNPRQRQMMLVEETSRWIENSLKKIQDCDDGNSNSNSCLNNNGEYLTAKRIEYVEPIFESIWASAVVALSILLESSEDPRVINLCLSGFKYGIHVSAAFFMETERSAFVLGLEKFTSMTSVCEMRPKNIGAIRTLIGLALMEGDYLQGSWTSVLRCISFLDKFQLVKSGSKSDFLTNSEAGVSTPTKRNAQLPSPKMPELPPPIHESSDINASSEKDGGRRKKPSSMDKKMEQKKARIEVMNLQTITMTLGIDNTDIDAIFTSSPELNDNAIVYFVKSLCEISLDEISSPAPRNFSLQRIVEVATYNMNSRIRIVWSQIWTILQEHFIKCGCHNTTSVSMYALDSLRQLAMKYLEKDELVSYNFQKEFLKPFEIAVSQTASEPVKEFIVTCLRQIVSTRTTRISSGWKTIFVILTTCAEQSCAALEKAAFDLLSMVMKKHYAVAAANFFVELVSALVAFGKSPIAPEISMRAVAFLYECADKLLTDSLSQNSTEKKEKEEENEEEEEEEEEREKESEDKKETNDKEKLITDTIDDLRAWFPILTGLASICSHPHIDVRSSALSTLFSILTHAGKHFSPRLWELVFRGALIPIFGSVGYTPNESGSECSKPDNEWLSTSCLNALQSLTLLFTTYYDALKFLLPDLFRMFSAFLTQYNEALANLTSASFFQFVSDNAHKFSDDVWALIITLIINFFDQSVPFLARVANAAAKGEFMFDSKSAPIAPTPLKKYDDVTSGPILVDGEEDSDAEHEKKISFVYSSTELNKIVTCNLCKAQGPKKEFLQCPMCGLVYYCSQKCQNADWPEHQKVCTYNIKIDPLNRLKRSGSGRFVTLSPQKNPTHKKQAISHKANKSSNSSTSSAVLTKKVLAKCNIINFVIRPLDNLMNKYFNNFKVEDLLSVVKSLDGLLSVVSTFITNDALRRYTRDIGLEGKFIRTESYLLDFGLKFMFKMYYDSSLPEDIKEDILAAKHLVPLANELMVQHMSSGVAASDARVANVVLVLEKLYSLGDDQYIKHYTELYDNFTHMIMDFREEVRGLIVKHFIRIGEVSKIC